MKPRARLAAALACLTLAATACAKHAPLDTLKPQGPIAHDIKNLWDLVFILAVIVFFLVEGAILVALFKFRHRKGDDRSPKQTHGNTRLEITWTIVPAVMLAIIAVPTVVGIAA